MSQEELVGAISERAGMSRQTVQQILESISRVWTDEIMTVGELDLDNIGTFLLDHRPARRGVNTETRELFVIPPTDFVSFTPAPELIEWSNRIQ
jgi:nucleoid DNA-binding protein